LAEEEEKKTLNKFAYSVSWLLRNLIAKKNIKSSINEMWKKVYFSINKQF